MTRRITRMSFLKRPHHAGAEVRHCMPQYAADMVYAARGRYGDVLLTLRMQSGGDTIEIRISPDDWQRLINLEDPS